MARTTPVHSGYTIINGSGNGSNGNRIDVWAEYKLGTQSVSGNYTPITVYFYAALNSAYSSTTKYVGGLNSTCKVNGTAGTGVTAGDYDFTSSSKVNFLGSYSGNIAHDNDGKKTVSLSCSFTTKSSYITGGSVSANVSLPTILRASAITAAAGVILGKACSVKWTPNSTAFRYKLKFSIGSWAYTTAAIHPNKTSAYTYTGYTLPIAVAAQISGSKTGTMTVVLTTYSDSGCTTAIGTDTETFTVTVPENDETKPIVTMELTPVSPIDGLYLQEVSRVQAAISAAGQLKADIKSYSLAVQGRSYGIPYLSNYLTTVGDVTVTGSAVDTRGITGTNKQTITVLPYYKPKLTDVKAYRCTAEGIQAENGEYLKIEATRDYAKVVTADDVQHNFCTVSYRYKTESADGYSENVEILAADAEGNSVETDALLNATFSKEMGYFVQIVATDTVGQETVVTISVPNEYVFRHKRAGGKGLGLGGYCAEDDMLDVHWRLNARQEILGLSVNFRGLCEDANVAYLPGTYILTTATANAPGTEGMLLVFNASATGSETALVFQVAVASKGIVRSRTIQGGTVTAWRTITMT